jgi:ribosomal-protein-serine acetyltransferase
MNLETEIDGLWLSSLAAGSLDEYYSLVDRNREHLTRYGDYAELGAATLESIRDDLASNPDQAFRLGIRLNVLIGRVDLVPREPGNYVLGYWLDEGQTGHGYATAACRAIIEFARTRGATTVWAGVTKGNESSLDVLRRLGFIEVQDMGSYVRYQLVLPPAEFQ